jgi:hypothetical protein
MSVLVVAPTESAAAVLAGEYAHASVAEFPAATA